MLEQSDQSSHPDSPRTDELLMHQSVMIQAMLWSLFVVSIWYIGYTVIDPSAFFRRLVIGGTMTVVAFAGMILARRGYVRIAGGTVIGGAWLTVFFAAYTAGGLKAAAFTGFLIPIIASGAVFGWLPSLILVLLSALSGVLFMVLDSHGMMPVSAAQSQLRNLSVTTGFFLIGWIVVFAINLSIRRALSVANKRMQEKEKIEEQFRRSELLYRQAIETIGAVPYSDTLQPHTYTFMGEGILQLTGYSASEMTPEIWNSLVLKTFPIGEAAGLPMQEAIHRAAEGKLKVWKSDCQIRMRDGTLKWITDSAVPVWDEQGNVKGSVGILQDITDRRQAEEILRTSEERYRILAENISDVIWTTDLSFNLTYISPSIERFSGWKAEEMLTMKLSDFMTPESVESASAVLAKELALERAHQRSPYKIVVLELEQVKKDRSRFWSELAVRFLKDAQGIPVGLIGVSRDISERKLAEQQRERLEEQLIQAVKMESVGRLAGGIAHDFNNMLTPIIGYAEMLQSSPRLNETEQGRVEHIVRAALKSRDLVGQLLAFARKQTLEMKPFDLNTILSDMHDIIRRTLREDIQITYVLAGSLPAIRADHGQLTQIILNLAVNAQDAMPRGGTIIVETSPIFVDEDLAKQYEGAIAGEYILMSFSDTGVGIGKEYLDKIFEPFFTTKGLGKGTGLGLSMIYGIVRQHRGFITVYSEEGSGTTFKIFFPQYYGNALPIKQSIPPPLPVQGSGTVLVVEDQEQVLSMLVESLEEKGFTTLEAKDVRTALSILETKEGKEINMLITDVVLPDGDGKNLYKQLSAIIPGLKVLFMSGYTAEVINKHGILDEGVHFIQKPFSTRQFSQKVNEVLAMGEKGSGG
ncbi:MAG: PAS domain S-box protein [bacterium]